MPKVNNSRKAHIDVMRFKELTKETGHSAREIAEIIGTTEAYLSRRLHSGTIDRFWLAEIAKILKTSTEYLSGRKEDEMEIKFDFSMLRGKIREVCGSELKFGDAMSWSQTTLYAKLNGQVDFKQSEILRACDILDIMTEFIPVYFFTVKVSNSKLEEGDEDESL